MRSFCKTTTGTALRLVTARLVFADDRAEVSTAPIKSSDLAKPDIAMALVRKMAERILAIFPHLLTTNGIHG